MIRSTRKCELLATFGVSLGEVAFWLVFLFYFVRVILMCHVALLPVSLSCFPAPCDCPDRFHLSPISLP